MTRWRRDPVPTSPETYDNVLVVAIELRLPVMGRSGGEFWYVRCRGDVLVDSQPRHASLEPGEADDLPEAFLNWLRDRLAARGLLSEAAERDARPLVAPPPTLPSGDPLFGLGR